MDTEYIVGRLQTPADKDGKRTDVHLLTTVDCVMMPNKTDTTNPEDNSLTLETLLSQMNLQVGSGKPNFACLWAKEKRTETVVENLTV